MKNAKEREAMKKLLAGIHDISVNYGMGCAPASKITALRKTADLLGAREELDDFMEESWDIHRSKKA